MIISASRRTDIPAFYATWFINRIRAGYCTVPNPFNPSQVSRISLKPEDVDVLVFVTRNPKLLMPYLDELDRRGLRYYFHYTLMNNPPQIDPGAPPLEHSLNTFRRLAEQVGAEKVIWRYDPIVLTTLTGVEFHREAYAQIAHALAGYTQRSVISILDIYAKARKRLEEMGKCGAPLLEAGVLEPLLGELVPEMVTVAGQNGMQIQSCAEVLDLQRYGVQPGSCVDGEYIRATFGIQVPQNKDPGQRKACRCVVSRDIGMYDTCLFGCRYCYATTSFERAKMNHQQHQPESPSLLGWYEAPAAPPETGQMSLWEVKP